VAVVSASQRDDADVDYLFLQLPPSGHGADVEHPAGHLEVEVELDTSVDPPRVISAGVIRTARKLFDGLVFPATTGPLR